MTRTEQVPSPSLKELSIEVSPPDQICLSGTLTRVDEVDALSAFLQRLHAAVLEDGFPRLCVDVAGLTFVNSTALRLFVAWTSWIVDEPHEKRYRLQFVINPGVTWQKTTVMALVELAGGVVFDQPDR
jgi:hypothetical protein